MIQSKHMVPFVLLGAALIGVTGCSSIDRLGTQMDMAVGRISESSKPVYEGRLKNFRQFGTMTAIQFSDDTNYDVVEAPAGLRPGDLVRIYKVDQGYEAHLWREGTE